MSSVAQVIEPSLQTESSSPSAAPKSSGLRRLLGRNIWAFGDQVLISGSNFAIMVLTARAFGDRLADFGTFSVIYGVLLWCNIFQGTLITQAHNVLGAIRSGRDYKRYTSSTAIGQLFIVAIEALLTLPVVAFAYFAGWSSLAMLIALIPSIVAWQLQEYVRRVMYTEGKYVDAFLNDIVSYGGQTLLIIGLYAASVRGGRPFSGASAFYALAITSAIAAALGVWQIRHSLCLSISRDDLKENWHFGKWLAGGELLGWCSSIHMMVWWAAALIGMVASADLKAAQILFGPTRVIAFFLGTVLPTRFARKLHQEGAAAMHRSVRIVFLLLAPTVGLYCLLLALFPKPLLTIMFDAKYSATAATVVKLYSLCAFLTYMQMVVAAALMAARQTRYIFAGSVVGCVIALLTSPMFIYTFGANGAILSMILTTLVVTVLYCRAYLQQNRTQKDDPQLGFAGAAKTEESK